jgi:hypothetical protein
MKIFRTDLQRRLRRRTVNPLALLSCGYCGTRTYRRPHSLTLSFTMMDGCHSLLSPSLEHLVRANTRLLTDAYPSALRASFGAAKPER